MSLSRRPGPPSRAVPSASRAAPTATSGSPNSHGDQIGRITPTARPSPSSPTASRRAASRRHHGRARTATSGSPSTAASRSAGSPPTASITEFTDRRSTPAASVLGITAGPGRQPLVHRVANGTIGRITPGGRHHRVHAPASAATPADGIAAGPGRQPLVHRAVRRPDRPDHPGGRRHRVHAGLTPDASPSASRPGPDGNLWFTEMQPRPASGASPRPASSPSSRPPTRRRGSRTDIAAGADGNLWFTEQATRTGSAASRRPASSPSSPPASPPTRSPSGIAAGPDGNLWFTELDGGRIGRILTGVVPVVTTPPVIAGTAAVGQVLTATGGRGPTCRPRPRSSGSGAPRRPRAVASRSGARPRRPTPSPPPTPAPSCASSRPRPTSTARRSRAPALGSRPAAIPLDPATPRRRPRRPSSSPRRSRADRRRHAFDVRRRRSEHIVRPVRVPRRSPRRRSGRPSRRLPVSRRCAPAAAPPLRSGLPSGLVRPESVVARMVRSGSFPSNALGGSRPTVARHRSDGSRLPVPVAALRLPPLRCAPGCPLGWCDQSVATRVVRLPVRSRATSLGGSRRTVAAIAAIGRGCRFPSLRSGCRPSAALRVALWAGTTSRWLLEWFGSASFPSNALGGSRRTVARTSQGSVEDRVRCRNGHGEFWSIGGDTSDRIRSKESPNCSLDSLE